MVSVPEFLNWYFSSRIILVTRHFESRDPASSSVPAAVAGTRRQRVPHSLVCQLLVVGPGRLPWPGADVRRVQGGVDVRPPGRLPAELRRSDGDHLVDRTCGSESVSGCVLARKGR